MVYVAADTGGTYTDILVLKDKSLTAHKIRGSKNPSDTLVNWLKNEMNCDFILLHGTTVATNAVLENKMPEVRFVTDKGYEDIIHIGRQSREELYEFEPKRQRLINGIPSSETVAVSLINGFERQEEETNLVKKVDNFSLSSIVDPNIREFERATSTWTNAKLLDIIKAYIENLSSASQIETLVMASSGGLVKAENCLNLPIITLLSGPAAGVVACHKLTRQEGIEKAIAFDMGGTSTDVSLIVGDILRTDTGSLRSTPIRTPRIDVHTIGCGGGSIAWIDDGLALRVGPASAGANPGPAFFGGCDFTVSDANLYLQRLSSQNLEANGDSVDFQNTNLVCNELSQKLGISKIQTAEAVIEIANAAMALAIRNITSQKGLLPSDFSLISYGGAAGLHCCQIAEILGITKIVIPQLPGLFSALGLLQSPKIIESQRFVFSDWRGELIQALTEAKQKNEGEPSRQMITLHMMFDGQTHDLPISITIEDSDESINNMFLNEHIKRFGMSHKNRKIKVRAFTIRLETDQNLGQTRIVSKELKPESGFIGRESITKEKITGPIKIVQADTTIYVPLGWDVHQSDSKNLILTR